MIFNKYLFITESLHFFGTEKTSSAKSFSDSCSSIGIMSEVLILVFSCVTVYFNPSRPKNVCAIFLVMVLYIYIFLFANLQICTLNMTNDGGDKTGKRGLLKYC